MRPEPFRIEPIFSPRLWGSRSLAPLFPDKTNLTEPLGEAWLTGVDCKIATGPFAGKSLGEAWKQMPLEWRGSRLATVRDFPILVKFIFPRDKLSIQVHPDDAYAAAHEQAAGGRGKTEMWHVVSAEPGAQVLVGLKPGTTKDQFLAALANHTAEDLLLPHLVKAGDTLFIPARTPHTIGPGMVLCEVQEYSDLTYRVYDYGRTDSNGKPRELHVEKAMQVMNFGLTISGKTRRLSLPAKSCDSSLLAACSHFAAEFLQPKLFHSNTEASHFDLLVILSGSGIIDGSGFTVPYRQGECWFLPANLGQFYVAPGAKLVADAGDHQQSPDAERTTMIRAYVPDLALLRDEILRSEGKPASALAQTVFE